MSEWQKQAIRALFTEINERVHLEYEAGPTAFEQWLRRLDVILASNDAEEAAEAQRILYGDPTKINATGILRVKGLGKDG